MGDINTPIGGRTHQDLNNIYISWRCKYHLHLDNIWAAQFPIHWKRKTIWQQRWQST